MIFFLVEICLLTRAKRVAGVRCVTYCNLYSLDAAQFETVLESYPLMRRTMESVAAERLNKLGKNPSIISTRHDLKRDAAVLKDIIDHATPQPSSDDNSSSDNDTDNGEEQQTDSSSSLNKNKEFHLKSSLIDLSDRLTKSTEQLQNLNKKSRRRKKRRRKSSSSDKNFKKLSRLFLAAPSPILNSTLDENKKQLRKSPSTPWSLFRKSGSTTPSLYHQPSS